ncbi:unnamed protein product, partial [Fusarium langsethiae]
IKPVLSFTLFEISIIFLTALKVIARFLEGYTADVIIIWAFMATGGVDLDVFIIISLGYIRIVVQLMQPGPARFLHAHTLPYWMFPEALYLTRYSSIEANVDFLLSDRIRQ